jgi:hypothetical protein
MGANDKPDRILMVNVSSVQVTYFDTRKRAVMH